MAYRLRIVAGPGLGSEVDLDADEITIGRAPENGLVINDNNVSRVHARVTVGDRIIVNDNGSRNGVFVNDKKVEQQPIKPGDRVVIGQTVLELVSDAPPPRPAARSAQRVAPSGAGGAMAATGAVSTVRPNSGAQKMTAPQQNGRSGAVQKAPPRPGAMKSPGPGSGGKPAAVAKASGGIPKPVLIAVVGVGAVLVLAVGASMFGGGDGGVKNAGGQTGTPRPKVTPPIITQTGGGDTGRMSKVAQQWLDVGDSNRVSQNHVAARNAYRQALKAEPTCLSCSVRLDAVNREIDQKISDRTKSGQLAYEAGDYQRAIDQWKIAVEFIGDPKHERARTLQGQINDAARRVEKQPQ